jgi:glycosyltransferase involved in cell wall biosynthesis
MTDSDARTYPTETGGSSVAKPPPPVSVVTPVYNGAKYLRACIESVLAQSHGNWDYTLVDNCSTDDSLAIAREYAQADPRVRVQGNAEFVGAIANHNRAFRAVSPVAKYCKLLSADDWMYEDCLAKLVDVAERHPSVGIVGSYAATAAGVRSGGPPLRQEVLPGREAVRGYLLGAIDSFWTPSTVLYRASLIRGTDAFFPGSAPSADLEASLNCLTTSDLGFVHQILSFERVHDEATTAAVAANNSQLLDRLRILSALGPGFLSATEQERRLNEQLAGYFGVLADGCFNFRDSAFWRLHKDGLADLGYSIYDPRFARAIGGKFLDLTLNPKATTEKIVRRVKSRQRGARAG